MDAQLDAQWQNPRPIRERLIVAGSLILETPTHLGNGDAEGPLDMPLLLDPLEGKALLTGTSIAGALRNYVRQSSPPLADLLFGRVTITQSVESLLIVDDALGDVPRVELRDGVAIDPATRTAEAKKKFDVELLAAGMRFPLVFELLVVKGKKAQLRSALALALHGLEKGHICLGQRKRRGFGRCRVSRWTLRRYDLTTPPGLIAWLENDPTGQTEGQDIATLLGVSLPNQRPACVLEGDFLVDSSLLIRSGSGAADSPDMVHLHSWRDGQEVPVLSGTSLAGALRARALRIANTLGKDGQAITNQLFGYRRSDDQPKGKLTTSRLWVEEADVQQPLELVQSRVKIDRFTGGSYPAALFSEQPVFGRKATRVRVRLTLPEATDQEVGLLLLLLKDLWTGDLPLGGESSVGRGRLKGEHASLSYQDKRWEFAQQEGDILHLAGDGDKDQLETFVRAFVEG